MNIRMKALTALTTLLVGTSLFSAPLTARPSHLRYPDNLAWRLITENEIKNITNCPQRPGNEQSSAAPLFSQPHAPLGEVQVAHNEKRALESAPKTWDVAPFPYIAPPSDDAGWKRAMTNTSAEAANAPMPQAPSAEAQDPLTFSDIESFSSPAAQLRPRRRDLSEDLLLPTERLPEPFSLRRYSTDDYGFFQIAIYGGYSSINAEIAYKTLRSASPNRQAISGLGDEAFLSLVDIQPDDYDDLVRDRNDKLTPESFDNPDVTMSFSDIAPEGQKRLDLSDASLIKSQQAPFFNDVPIAADSLTSILPQSLPQALRDTGAADAASIGGEIVSGDYPTLPTSSADSMPVPAAAPVPMAIENNASVDTSLSAPLGSTKPESFSMAPLEPEKRPEDMVDPFAKRPALGTGKGHSVLVLVMHFPKKDVVVEMAMDTRMGSLQNLIAMAFLVQNRLLNRWG